MPKYVVDISLSIERLIRAKVKAGTYDSFNHFVAVALENQLNVEEGDTSVWPSVAVDWQRETGQAYQSPTIRMVDQTKHRPERSLLPQQVDKLFRSLVTTIDAKPKILEEPKDEQLVGTLLWGQFYRFLPGKPALRVLSSMSLNALPSLIAFKEKACNVAQKLGSLLRDNDREKGRKRGEKFSGSFPEPTAKSRRRYKEQYIGYVRPSDGKLDGMLPRLKFINIVKDGDIYKVGLTRPALEFAKLWNPIFDGEGEPQPLSHEEAEFLIKHVIGVLPKEARHMQTMLHLIDSGVSSRTHLNSEMRSFYSKYHDQSQQWSSAMVNTMRAGLLSRLVELGLISKSKSGLTVKYGLTEWGKHILEKEFGGVS